MMIRTVLVSLALCAAASCGGEKEAEPAPKAEAGKTEAKPPDKPKSNIVKITTAVPYGKQVDCANIFDAPKFAELTGLEVGEVRDRSSSNREMTSTCAFMRAGEPPKNDTQLREFEKNNRKLGVLPGDEYCTISLNCSLATTAEDLKKRCEEDGKASQGMTQYEDNEDLGQYSCVRKTDRPPDSWAYTYRTVHAGTGCTLEVMGGPSITDEELVQKCSNAGLQMLAKEDLATFH